MEIRRNLIKTIFVVIIAAILLSCSAKIPAEITQAEIEATQAAIAREEEYAERAHTIQMNLVYIQEFLKLFWPGVAIFLVFFLAKSFINYLIEERKFERGMTALEIDGKVEPLQKTEHLPSSSEVKEIQVITGVAFDDLIEKAEEEFMNE